MQLLLSVTPARSAKPAATTAPLLRIATLLQSPAAWWPSTQRTQSRVRRRRPRGVVGCALQLIGRHPLALVLRCSTLQRLRVPATATARGCQMALTSCNGVPSLAAARRAKALEGSGGLSWNRAVSSRALQCCRSVFGASAAYYAHSWARRGRQTGYTSHCRSGSGTGASASGSASIPRSCQSFSSRTPEWWWCGTPRPRSSARSTCCCPPCGSCGVTLREGARLRNAFGWSTTTWSTTVAC
mmetsp:Transcript_74521/g.207043  ORF Transcript_74521/g.207043 Transcript_74521/m.207043 type:complete len:242 (-) Transcript_74521:334-1059(-)